MPNKNSRRTALKNLAAGTAALGIIPLAGLTFGQAGNKKSPALKGNVNHSVCRWCFNNLSVDELCNAVKKIGFSAIDLVGPKDWDVLKKSGITSSMCNGAEINLVNGWNEPKYHSTLIKNYTEHIDLVAKAGYKNLICFSGNRNGMDDETGLKNCVSGLKQVIGLAEKRGVVLQMELLNSKVNHKDYMCDKTPWGVELCKQLGSENFKLLYDIYHMQIDEGDVISTIKTHNTYLGHYHTAGVPGRHEIDDTQELYYPAIMRAIVATGFKGYVAQEFIPLKEDKLASLTQGIRICDV